MCKALVVDDYKILLEGIAQMVSSHPLVRMVDKSNDPLCALEKLKSNNYDLLISDYEMPQLNGAELTRHTKNHSPNTKVIILSMHDEFFTIGQLLDLNVSGYVLKKNMNQDLPMAISSILKGEEYFSTEVYKLKNQFDQIKNQKSLSTRELQILELMAQNRSNQQIADELLLNVRTIETHEKNMLRKTQTNRRSELVRWTIS